MTSVRLAPAGSQLESMPDPVKNFWEAPSTPYQWKHSHVSMCWASCSESRYNLLVCSAYPKCASPVTSYIHLPTIDLLDCYAAIWLAGDSRRDLHVWVVPGHAEPADRQKRQGPKLMVHSVASQCCNVNKQWCTMLLG